MKIKSFIQFRAKVLLNAYKNLIHEGNEVLDVGCGSGWLAKIIQRKIHCKLTGIDIGNFLQARIPFKVMGSKSEIPYEDNSFDVVMFNGVLHHMSSEDQYKLIKEGLRVSDSILIFDAYNTFPNKLLCWIMCKLRLPLRKVYQNYKELDDYKRLFKTLNLNHKNLEIKTAWYYPLKHFAYKLNKIK